jgi:AhpD family alkylhydroperoxidase
MTWTNLLNTTVTNLGNLQKETTESFKGFNVMGRAAKFDGELSEKMKELIALGIAISTRCDSSIGFHTKSLVRLGTTRGVFCEVLAMCSYMSGPSIAFSAKALEAYDELSNNR